MSILSCNDEISRECSNCPEYEPNRIIHVAFVKKGTTFTTNWGTATNEERAQNLLDAELACNAIIFRNVNGTKADPTKSELPGRGRQTTQTGRTTHTVAISDHDYVTNQRNGFYNALERNAKLYDFYYMTENEAWQVNDTFLKIAAFDPITEDNTTNIIGRVDVTWQQMGNPINYAMDTDSLEGCQVICSNLALAGSAYKGEYDNTWELTNLTQTGDTYSATIPFAAQNTGSTVEIQLQDVEDNCNLENVTISILSSTLVADVAVTYPKLSQDGLVTLFSFESSENNRYYSGTVVVRFSNPCGSVMQDLTFNFTVV